MKHVSKHVTIEMLQPGDLYAPIDLPGLYRTLVFRTTKSYGYLMWTRRYDGIKLFIFNLTDKNKYTLWRKISLCTALNLMRFYRVNYSIVNLFHLGKCAGACLVYVSC